MQWTRRPAGDTSSRASPDARRNPPRTVWLSAGVPYLTALCSRPKPHGDCRRFCFAHAPACMVSCTRIARGVSASVLTKKGRLSIAVQTSILVPWLKRSLGAML